MHGIHTHSHARTHAGQLVATLGKLLLFRLDEFFDIRDVFSASGVNSKLACFARIAEMYGGGGSGVGDGGGGDGGRCFLVVGDGTEEQRATLRQARLG